MHGNSHWIFLKQIIITGKQVIYPSRLRKSKALLKYIECIEYYVAKRRDGINFHEKHMENHKKNFFKFLSYHVVAILYKH